jgi:hypothetical protein
MLVVHVTSCSYRTVPQEPWQFMLPNVGLYICCITCQSLRYDARYSDLVIPKTTPHVYGKWIFVFAFELSMWITIIQYTRVSAIFDSMAG